jgi:hypothetical protein
MIATYKEIQNRVKQNYGFVPKTCWIVEVKEISGLSVRKVHNRRGSEKVNPCPREKVEPIRATMSCFRMIE